MFLSLTFFLLQAVQFLLHTEPALRFTVSALVCARDNQPYGALPAVVLRPRDLCRGSRYRVQPLAGWFCARTIAPRDTPVSM